MRLTIRQTFQGQPPPNFEDAVIQSLNVLFDQACAEIARDLRIKRDQVELQKRRGTGKTEHVETARSGLREEDKVWDVFICHASEDKESFVRPLVNALTGSVKVWYDEMTLTVGDSLRQKIDHGLANSRFGIVVLSKAFFSKNWPQAELDGLMSREMAGKNTKVILPVWHSISREDVLKYSPLLAGRLVANSNEGMDLVVAKLQAAMGISSSQPSSMPVRQEIEKEPNEYCEQRRRLPDNAVFNERRTRGWRGRLLLQVHEELLRGHPSGLQLLPGRDGSEG
jgi:hypothetical protein